MTKPRPKFPKGNIIKINKKEAEQALRDAYAEQDDNAVYFWSGYLLALS